MNRNPIFTEPEKVNDDEINNLEKSTERDEKLRATDWRQHLVTSNISY